MAWENILKVMTGTQFMEGLQQQLGGNVSGGITGGAGVKPSNKGGFWELRYDGGLIKLLLQSNSMWKVNVNGQGFTGYDLVKLQKEVLEMV